MEPPRSAWRIARVIGFSNAGKGGKGGARWDLGVKGNWNVGENPVNVVEPDTTKRRTLRAPKLAEIVLG